MGDNQDDDDGVVAIRDSGLLPRGEDRPPRTLFTSPPPLHPRHAKGNLNEDSFAVCVRSEERVFVVPEVAAADAA